MWNTRKVSKQLCIHFRVHEAVILQTTGHHTHTGCKLSFPWKTIAGRLQLPNGRVGTPNCDCLTPKRPHFPLHLRELPSTEQLKSGWKWRFRGLGFLTAFGAHTEPDGRSVPYLSAGGQTSGRMTNEVRRRGAGLSSRFPSLHVTLARSLPRVKRGLIIHRQGGPIPPPARPGRSRKPSEMKAVQNSISCAASWSHSGTGGAQQ